MSGSVFKILIVGDIVGKSGRNILLKHLPSIKINYNLDFIIVNGENSAGGFGISSKIVDLFLSNQIDVITSGNHIWKNKDVFKIINTEKRLLRPLNFPPNVPGLGYNIYNKSGIKILVVNLLGRINLLEVDCPFQTMDNLLKKISVNDYDFSIIDFHAETTSEKIAMGWFLDGRINAIVGTHTHVQTADEKILPQGTAYITDIGMTGSFDSVIGVEKEPIIAHFLTRMPAQHKVAEKNPGINSVLITFDILNKKAIKIERINIFE